MSSLTNHVDAELPYSVEASWIEKRSKILVKDRKSQDQLRSKGFGENLDSEFVLQTYEALYLLYTRRLVLSTKMIKNITFDSLLNIALRRDKEILTKFLIYRDLRSRGYVTKEGFGFGIDFRVYEKGEFEKKPAKYVVFGINEGVQAKASEVSKAISQITKMGKSAVAAVIERRGEITYYKVSKARFENNKFNPKFAAMEDAESPKEMDN
jgi:tRNA-intron endonuclease